MVILEEVPSEPGDEQVGDEIDPVALALGKLVYSWNLFHTFLQLFFLELINGGSDDPYRALTARAVWNAIPNDRMQRNMLREVALIRFPKTDEKNAAIQ